VRAAVSRRTSQLHVDRVGRLTSPDKVRFMARGNFGERLKRERELREVSPNEVVVATRISLRFLEALENEDWEKLPGGVFNRGFVRAIARYLGLNEETLLAEYDLARGDQSAEAPPAPENRIPSPPKWLALALALGVLLLIGALVAAGVYGWRRYSAHRRAKMSSAIVPLDLSVSSSAVTHVRILADGNLVLDSELQARQNRHFPAETAFEVTAADSSAVLLELNGQTIPPIGSPGTSGTIVLSQKDLRPAAGGNSQP
jgi:cytoskeleton protein RodZ